MLEYTSSELELSKQFEFCFDSLQLRVWGSCFSGSSGQNTHLQSQIYKEIVLCDLPSQMKAKTTRNKKKLGWPT